MSTKTKRILLALGGSPPPKGRVTTSFWCNFNRIRPTARGVADPSRPSFGDEEGLDGISEEGFKG